MTTLRALHGAASPLRQTLVLFSLSPREDGEGDGWICPQPPLQAEEAQLSLNAHINTMPLKMHWTYLVLSEEEALPPPPSIIQGLGRHSRNDQAAAPSVQLRWAVWRGGKASLVHDSTFQSLV